MVPTRFRKLLAQCRSFSCIGILGLTTIGWLAGCTTQGPAHSDQMPSLANQALPEKSTPMVHSAAGEWFPNVKGFNDVRSNPFSPVNRQAGVLVLTEDALFFEQWDSKTKNYSVVKRIPLSEIRAMTVDTYGASRRIVLQNQDYSYNSFGLTQAGGLLVDRGETDIIVRELSKRLPSTSTSGIPR